MNQVAKFSGESGLCRGVWLDDVEVGRHFGVLVEIPAFEGGRIRLAEAGVRRVTLREDLTGVSGRRCSSFRLAGYQSWEGPGDISEDSFPSCAQSSLKICCMSTNFLIFCAIGQPILSN